MGWIGERKRGESLGVKKVWIVQRGFRLLCAGEKGKSLLWGANDDFRPFVWLISQTEKYCSLIFLKEKYCTVADKFSGPLNSRGGECCIYVGKLHAVSMLKRISEFDMLICRFISLIKLISSICSILTWKTFT
jgi:hypothetical protein